MIGWDEARYIIASSLTILQSESWSEVALGLTTAHGTLVHFGMQLVNMLSYFTVNTVSFKFINMFGIASLCGACLLILYSLNLPLAKKLILAAIMFPLVLTPVHNMCAVNSSCTSLHYLGLSLSIFSLYCFSRNNKCNYWFLSGSALMATAVLTLTATLPLFFIALYFIWQSPQRKLQLTVHCIILLLTLVIYFSRTWPLPETRLSIENTEDFFRFLIPLMLMFFRTLASNFFSYYGINFALTSLLGLLLFSYTLYFLISNRKLLHKLNNPFLLSCLLLALSIIAAISYGRLHSPGSSRYAAHAGMFLSLLVTIIFCLRETRPANPVSLKPYRLASHISMIYFFGALYIHTPPLKGLGAENRFCEASWEERGILCGKMMKHKDATRLAIEAEKAGIYHVTR